MRRLPLVLLAVLALAGFGGGAQKSKPLYGFVYRGNESWRLARLDPLTLAQRAGPSVGLGSRTSAWTFSPDRSTLAVTGNGLDSQLLLVDTVRMRRLGFVDMGQTTLVTATFWPEASRLYAVVTQLRREADGGLTPESTSLVAVDPAKRTVVGRQALDGYVFGVAHGAGVLALVLGPNAGVGPARLALVDAGGAVRTVALDGVQVGYDGFSEEGPAQVGHYAQPGLAVSPDGSRAFVVSPSQIAAVDLRSLRTSYHRLGSPRRLQRIEKGAFDGTYRIAMWARDGELLVSGRDDHASVDAQGRADTDTRPAGLQLVDTRDWSVKTIDPTADGASVGSDGILVMGWSWNAQRRRYVVGGGATIYSLDGVRRAHLFGKRALYGIAVGRRAFVGQDSGSYTIVSTTTGRVLRKVARPFPQPLLGAALDSS